MHKYRVTIQERGEADEQERERRSLHFDADNHDDLFQIISAVRSKKIFDHDKSAALATGLKLLSEVVLESVATRSLRSFRTRCERSFSN